MHVPSTAAKIGDFLTRPEVNMALGMMAPDIGALAWKPSMAMGGLARGVSSKLGQAIGAGTGEIPKFDPVASYSTPSAVAMSPLAAKDPFKQ
jgi:hypothetical protein